MEETNLENRPPLIRHAIIYGAIISACTITLTLMTYKVSIASLVTIKFALLGFLVGAMITVLAGIDFRKKSGGYLNYSRAFLYCFAVMAIAGLFSTAFNEVYYNLINPSFAEEFTTAFTDNMEGILRFVNSPDDAIDQAIEEAKVETPKQFTPGGLLFGYVKGLVVYSIISLIAAIFVKKGQSAHVEMKTT